MLTLRFAGKKMMAPLALFFLATFYFSSHPNPGSGNPGQRSFKDTTLVTVVAIRPSADGKSLRVTFNEKEQVLYLSSNEQDFTTNKKRFESALREKSPLRLITDEQRGTLLSLADLSPAELKIFRDLRKVKLPGEPVRPIEWTKIDTSTFNIVGDHLKWKVFTTCQNIVPSLDKAKEIFNYCAAQSCHIPGPKLVNPCIPFQYVKDGCYARAHKMRWIVEKHFGYCSEKVFSFATIEENVLAVRANKWGGCCVKWWYHVTPLIRVKVQAGSRSFILAYVIDPGMFNEPVLLSTWLNAQKNKTCNLYATVDSYSIQPSSAYTPSNYETGEFNTDPDYSQTNATLTSYATYVTCN